MNDSPELIFEFSRNGSAANTTVTARLGSEVLEVDKLDLSKSKSRSSFVDSICSGRAGIDRDAVDAALKQQAAVFAVDKPEHNDDFDQPSASDLLERMPASVRGDARAMLESPDLVKRIIDDVGRLGVAGERELILTIYLIGVSRLLSRPLAGIVQSPSSTGKSYTQGKTAELFPPEAIIHATSLTPQALFYMPPGSLSHKWILAGERSRLENDDTAEASRALREMISAGRLTKLIPVKDGGRIVTQTIEQEGPIAYIETTTLTKIFDEDANRCLLLNADERTEQTSAIVNCLAEGYAGSKSANGEAIIQKHHAAQRMLQQRSVVVPFAEKIANRFPTDRVEARRAFPHLMGMIQASAIIHQLQRQIDADGQIIAEPCDYQLARRLVRGPLGRLLGGSIAPAAIRFYDRLNSWAGRSGSFTTTEVVKKDRVSDRAIRGWLNELAGVGAVEQVSEGRGSKPATWRCLDIDRAELAIGDCGLPEVQEIC